MKNLLIAVVAVMLVAGSAAAATCGPKTWDDMSWWGNTGATPAPTADTKGRSGYWWWPIEPATGGPGTITIVF